jgi:hypothetical protein
VEPFHRLEISTYEFTFESEQWSWADFLIDGKSLCDVFGYNDLCRRTGFDFQPEAVHRFIQQLLGLVEPTNQLGSKRLGLYLCYCGCDECGFISCEVIRNERIIEWRDIREELPFEDNLPRIESLKFDLAQYEAAIWRYQEKFKRG